MLSPRQSWGRRPRLCHFMVTRACVYLYRDIAKSHPQTMHIDIYIDVYHRHTDTYHRHCSNSVYSVPHIYNSVGFIVNISNTPEQWYCAILFKLILYSGISRLLNMFLLIYYIFVLLNLQSVSIDHIYIFIYWLSWLLRTCETCFLSMYFIYVLLITPDYSRLTPEIGGAFYV